MSGLTFIFQESISNQTLWYWCWTITCLTPEQGPVSRSLSQMCLIISFSFWFWMKASQSQSDTDCWTDQLGQKPSWMHNNAFSTQDVAYLVWQSFKEPELLLPTQGEEMFLHESRCMPWWMFVLLQWSGNKKTKQTGSLFWLYTGFFYSVFNPELRNEHFLARTNLVLWSYGRAQKTEASCVGHSLELFKFMTSFEKVFKSSAIKEIIKGAFIKCQLFSMQKSSLWGCDDGDKAALCTQGVAALAAAGLMGIWSTVVMCRLRKSDVQQFELRNASTQKVSDWSECIDPFFKQRRHNKLSVK